MSGSLIAEREACSPLSRQAFPWRLARVLKSISECCVFANARFGASDENVGGARVESLFWCGREIERMWTVKYTRAVQLYYYYFIFASQHDPLAPLARESGTPHSAAVQAGFNSSTDENENY